jgi:hypothetical protein
LTPTINTSFSVPTTTLTSTLTSTSASTSTSGLTTKAAPTNTTGLISNKISQIYRIIKDTTIALGANNVLGSSFKAANKFGCLSYCMSSVAVACQAATYDSSKRNCTTYSTYPLPSGQQLVSLKGSDLYFKI